MLEQLHRRFTNNCSFLREGEEERLSGCALLLPCLRRFLLVNVGQSVRCFRAVKFRIACRDEDDLAIAGEEIDRLLNEAGVICGPIYTIADIFEDPQFQARDMLLKHVDEEFGEYIGPGIVPKFSETPGAIRWSGTWEEGSHNDEVYCGLLGLTDSELRELREDGVV